MPASEPTQRQSFLDLAARMRFIASAMLIILPVGWFVWFYPYDDLLDRSGTPLGADYAMFYVAGQLAVDGDAAQLYNQAEHQRRLQKLFPGIDEQFCLPYRYPPFVALLMAPLACLPYMVSFGVFLGISLTAISAAIWLLSRQLALLRDGYRTTILIAVFGWPVVLETLIGGQASLLAVLIASGVIVCWQNQRWGLAGAVLALALYKPNVLGLFAIGCLLCQPKLLRGALPVALGLVGLSLATVGLDGLSQYAALSTQLASGVWDVETPLWKVHGLASWFTYFGIIHEKALSCLIGLLLVVCLVIRWRTVELSERSPQLLALGLLLTINALLNAYTPIYDLTLLVPAALLTVESLIVRGTAADNLQPARGMLWVYASLTVIYFGPHLSQSIAQLIGCQLFALGLAALAVWQARQFWAATRPAPRPAPANQNEEAVAGSL